MTECLVEPIFEREKNTIRTDRDFSEAYNPGQEESWKRALIFSVRKEGRRNVLTDSVFHSIHNSYVGSWNHEGHRLLRVHATCEVHEVLRRGWNMRLSATEFWWGNDWQPARCRWVNNTDWKKQRSCRYEVSFRYRSTRGIVRSQHHRLRFSFRMYWLRYTLLMNRLRGWRT